MKRFRITCSTDAYHASRTARYKGREILKRDGATPVKWVHDDYSGLGYSLDDARKVLMSYAREDWEANDGKVTHRYFETSYDSDVWHYESSLSDDQTGIVLEWREGRFNETQESHCEAAVLPEKDPALYIAGKLREMADYVAENYPELI